MYYDFANREIEDLEMDNMKRDRAERDMNRLQRRAKTAWYELLKLAHAQGYKVADMYIDRTFAIMNFDGPDLFVVSCSYEGLLQALTRFKKQQVESE